MSLVTTRVYICAGLGPRIFEMAQVERNRRLLWSIIHRTRLPTPIQATPLFQSSQSFSSTSTARFDQTRRLYDTQPTRLTGNLSRTSPISETHEAQVEETSRRRKQPNSFVEAKYNQTESPNDDFEDDGVPFTKSYRQNHSKRASKSYNEIQRDSSSKVGIHKFSRPNPPNTIPHERPAWAVQKSALAAKFKSEPWNPRRKLSPDAQEGIRTLHEEDPVRYSTPLLAQEFKVSPEAIRRILKSKWKVTDEQMEERRQRWAKRHDRIWDTQVQLGLRPPRKHEKKTEVPGDFMGEVERKEIVRRAREEEPLLKEKWAPSKANPT